MVVKEFENAQLFLNEYEELLLQREAVSQLILYDAYQNLTTTVNEKCLFGAVLEADTVVLLFCNLAPHNLVTYSVVQEGFDAAAMALADYVNSRHIPISGINGKNEVCLNFIEQYKKQVNCSFIERRGMDIMEIRKLNDIKPVEGKHRFAEAEETKLIADWMIRFQMEAQASEMDYEEALKKATKLIEEHKIYIYEDTEQVVVTMAAVSRQLPHGIAINFVFTPEEYRGKGYAAANIYYLSKSYLEQGNEFCSLFVDKKNPLLNRAYEKVGYVNLEDNYDYIILI